MGTYICPVSASADDYDWQGTGLSTIEARYIRTVSPELISPLHYKCDTSSVPITEKVIGLTTRIFEHSYSASRGTAMIYTITMRDLIGIQKVNIQGITYLGVGLNRTITCPSSFFTYVYKGTGARTWLSISVPDPKAGKSRQFKIRSFDYAGTSYTPQVTVTTTDAERCFVSMTGLG